MKWKLVQDGTAWSPSKVKEAIDCSTTLNKMTADIGQINQSYQATTMRIWLMLTIKIFKVSLINSTQSDCSWNICFIFFFKYLFFLSYCLDLLSSLPHPLLICTWFLKNQVVKIEFGFLASKNQFRNYFLADYTGSKNPVGNFSSSTLASGIDVGPMFINFGTFSRPYSLIKGPTLINFLKMFRL